MKIIGFHIIKKEKKIRIVFNPVHNDFYKLIQFSSYICGSCRNLRELIKNVLVLLLIYICSIILLLIIIMVKCAKEKIYVL